MKKFYLLFFLLVSFSFIASAQKFWKGGGNLGQWSDPVNWVGGTPINTDAVVIDNLHGAAGSFTVTLPDNLVTVVSITITPDIGNTITVILPTTNVLQPGLILNGPGDVLVINNGGIFKNSTGAAGPSISLVNATDSIKINNGGKYVHNNIRSHAYLVDRLSVDPGTETGIFEFDIPPGPSALSLGGSKYGTLMLSSVAAGGNRSYNGLGSSDLTIRGDLIINLGVNFSPTITGNINIARHLDITGNFNFNPASAGVTNRSILFSGTTDQNISGVGNFTFNANFRNLEVLEGSKVFLQRDIELLANAAFIINTNGSFYTGTHFLSPINGIGNFIQNANSLLGIGSIDGITAAGASGNIQTTFRAYDNAGRFEYNASAPQVTGNGLPVSVADLIINNSANETVTLTKSVNIDNELNLKKGFLKTTDTEIPTLRDTTTIISDNSEYENCCGITNIGYENSFVNGPLNYEISTITKKWFPVGKITVSDTIFAPVALTKAAPGTVTYNAEYFPFAYSDLAVNLGPLHHVSSLEHWSINGNTEVASTAKVTLTWNPRSKVGNNKPLNDAEALDSLFVTHYMDDDGGGGNSFLWHVEGGDPTLIMPKEAISTVNYGTVTTIFYNSPFTNSSVSPFFTLGTRSPFNILPVKLLQFTAVKNNKNIAVQWQTKEEQNLSHYDIEKSLDGVTFEKTATLNAKNSILFNSYNHTDEHPQNGWNYYRLKITDAQHKITYSKTIKVKIEENDPIFIYPNPVNEELKINLPPSSSVYTINIVNTSGQVVKRVINANSNVTINVESLIKGVYFLHIHNDLQVLTRKFTKQ